MQKKPGKVTRDELMAGVTRLLENGSAHRAQAHHASGSGLPKPKAPVKALPAPQQPVPANPHPTQGRDVTPTTGSLTGTIATAKDSLTGLPDLPSAPPQTQLQRPPDPNEMPLVRATMELTATLQNVQQDHRIRKKKNDQMRHVLSRVDRIVGKWEQYEEEGGPIAEIEARLRANFDNYLRALQYRQDVHEYMFSPDAELSDSEKEEDDEDDILQDGGIDITTKARSSIPEVRATQHGEGSEEPQVSTPAAKSTVAQLRKASMKGSNPSTPLVKSATFKLSGSGSNLNVPPTYAGAKDDLLSQSSFYRDGDPLEDYDEAEFEETAETMEDWSHLQGEELLDAVRQRVVEAKYTLMSMPHYKTWPASRVKQRVAEVKQRHLTTINLLREAAGMIQQLAHEFTTYITRDRDARRRTEAIPPNARVGAPGPRMPAASISSEAPLPAVHDSQRRAPPTGQVAVVYTDIDNGAELWRRHKDDMKATLNVHNKLVRALIVKHEGLEARNEADAFMVVFPSTALALSFCIALQLQLLQQEWPRSILHSSYGNRHIDPVSGFMYFNGPRVRMGIHGGMVSTEYDPRTRRTVYYGPVVTDGARLLSIANGGEIVCSEVVYRELRPKLPMYGRGVTAKSLGYRRLKGAPKAMHAYQLTPKELEPRLKDFVTLEPEEQREHIMVEHWEPAFSSFYIQQKQVMTDRIQFIDYTNSLMQLLPAENQKVTAPSSQSVTIVAIEIDAAVRLWDYDPVMMHKSLLMYTQLVRKLAATYEGYEVRLQGDSYALAFSDPVKGQNLLLSLQIELLKLDWPASLLKYNIERETQFIGGMDLWRGLKTHAALHTGKCMVTENPVSGRSEFQGPLVNRVSAMARQAVGGQIVMPKIVVEEIKQSKETQVLFDPVYTSIGPVQLPSMQDPIDMFYVLPGVLRQRSESYRLATSMQEVLADAWQNQKQQNNEKMLVIERAKRLLEEDNSKNAIPQNPAPVGHVAFVFTDVQSSTKLWEEDTVGMVKAIVIHNTLMRKILTANKGYEVKTEGDAFMVTFSEEKDAAAYCLQAQLQLLQADWPPSILARPDACVVNEGEQLLWRGLRVRMGIHSGRPHSQVDPTTKRMDYYGPVVNKSARVSGMGRGGEIIISDVVLLAIQKHLAPLGHPVITLIGPKTLKGIPDPVTLHQMLPRALHSRKFASPAVEPDKSKDAQVEMSKWAMEEEQRLAEEEAKKREEELNKMLDKDEEWSDSEKEWDPRAQPLNTPNDVVFVNEPITQIINALARRETAWQRHLTMIEAKLDAPDDLPVWLLQRLQNHRRRVKRALVQNKSTLQMLKALQQDIVKLVGPTKGLLSADRDSALPRGDWRRPVRRQTKASLDLSPKSAREIEKWPAGEEETHRSNDSKDSDTKEKEGSKERKEAKEEKESKSPKELRSPKEKEGKEGKSPKSVRDGKGFAQQGPKDRVKEIRELKERERRNPKDSETEPERDGSTDSKLSGRVPHRSSFKRRGNDSASPIPEASPSNSRRTSISFSDIPSEEWGAEVELEDGVDRDNSDSTGRGSHIPPAQRRASNSRRAGKLSEDDEGSRDSALSQLRKKALRTTKLKDSAKSTASPAHQNFSQELIDFLANWDPDPLKLEQIAWFTLKNRVLKHMLQLSENEIMAREDDFEFPAGYHRLPEQPKRPPQLSASRSTVSSLVSKSIERGVLRSLLKAGHANRLEELETKLKQTQERLKIASDGKVVLQNKAESASGAMLSSHRMLRYFLALMRAYMTSFDAHNTSKQLSEEDFVATWVKWRRSEAQGGAATDDKAKKDKRKQKKEKPAAKEFKELMILAIEADAEEMAYKEDARRLAVSLTGQCCKFFNYTKNLFRRMGMHRTTAGRNAFGPGYDRRNTQSGATAASRRRSSERQNSAGRRGSMDRRMTRADSEGNLNVTLTGTRSTRSGSEAELSASPVPSAAARGRRRTSFIPKSPLRRRSTSGFSIADMLLDPNSGTGPIPFVPSAPGSANLSVNNSTLTLPEVKYGGVFAQQTSDDEASGALTSQSEA